MQMGKEQKNFLLPDEHIYHPLMRNSITVNAISPLVIFGLQAGFAGYYIIFFRKSPYQNAGIGFTIGFIILWFLFWFGLLRLHFNLFMKLRLVTSPHAILFYFLSHSITT